MKIGDTLLITSEYLTWYKRRTRFSSILSVGDVCEILEISPLSDGDMHIVFGTDGWAASTNEQIVTGMLAAANKTGE